MHAVGSRNNQPTIWSGRITDDFTEKMFTLGSKICQHTCFLVRPLICDFSKISKSGENDRIIHFHFRSEAI